MATQTLELWVTDDVRQPKTASGDVMIVPPDWDLLPPGDAALTRRVKAAGPAWVIKRKRGRRAFSQGVWAPKATIDRLRGELESERADPRYSKKLEAGRQRRAAEHEVYVVSFVDAVARFLDFAPKHKALERELAEAIARHATPVGSGTVARTQRIPIERRAEAATIAWLRHHTTGYDDMTIPRVKGMRREVRRMLAQRSRQLLERYRRGDAVTTTCPLRTGLRRATEQAS